MLFCVADPTHTLSPGEVSLHFSTGILDKRTGRSRTFIEGDLLVARNPALLPSDIQKVTAVYNKHLREIKDVIVFSAQGMRSLVSMLSGGDYDGDKVYVSIHSYSVIRLLISSVLDMLGLPDRCSLRERIT